MIGKVQDIVSAAVVIGAADRAGSGGGSASRSDSVQGGDASAALQSKELSGASSIEQFMQKDEPSAEQEKSDFKMDEETVKNMTDELNELMDKINCDIAFKYHEDVGMMSVSMVNKKTDEVIKELPPEEMVDNIKKAREWIGAFLDKNA